MARPKSSPVGLRQRRCARRADRNAQIGQWAAHIRGMLARIRFAAKDPGISWRYTMLGIRAAVRVFVRAWRGAIRARFHTDFREGTTDFSFAARVGVILTAGRRRRQALFRVRTAVLGRLARSSRRLSIRKQHGVDDVNNAVRCLVIGGNDRREIINHHFTVFSDDKEENFAVLDEDFEFKVVDSLDLLFVLQIFRLYITRSNVQLQNFLKLLDVFRFQESLQNVARDFRERLVVRSENGERSWTGKRGREICGNDGGDQSRKGWDRLRELHNVF